MTRAKSARDRKAKAGNGTAEQCDPNVWAPVDDAVIISADHLLLTQHGEDGQVLIHLVDEEGNGAYIPLDIDQITSLGKTCAHIVMEQRLEDAARR